MFVTIVAPSAGDPTKKQSFSDPVIANLTYLNSQLIDSSSSDSVPNASFEHDVDGNSEPDAWTWNATGGVIIVDDSSGNQKHGAKSIKITSSGSGGGYVESADFLAVSDASARRLTYQFANKQSGATVSVKFGIRYYDRTQAFISEEVIWNSSSGNPTSWTYKTFIAPTAPTDARFAKFRLYGANSATAGSTWFDDFRIIPERRDRVPQGIQQFSASSTFTVPDYITRIRVRAWGAGGGGGGRNTVSLLDGGGGGGGAYAEDIITVTAGETLTVTIGAGGAGGAGGVNAFDGVDGGDTILLRSATPLLTSGGGDKGGGDSTGPGDGGSGGTSSSEVNVTGQSGASAATGGKGGGAGLGTGAPNRTNNQAGTTPGGGGNGGFSGNTTGGAGATGRMIIEY